MVRYRFREGVHVSSDGDDVIITTPYAARLNQIRRIIRFHSVTDSFKNFLESLSENGVCCELFTINEDPCAQGLEKSDAVFVLEDLYAKGLLSTEIGNSKSAAIRLDPVKSCLRLRRAPLGDYRIRFSRFASIYPCSDGLSISSPLSSANLHLIDRRLFFLLTELASACTEESLRQAFPDDLLVHFDDLISLLLSSGVAGLCDEQGVADIDRHAVEAGWTSRDLAFHCQTREHEIDLSRMESSQTAVIQEQLPAKHQRIILQTVALPEPSRIHCDLNFFQVIRDRHTIRTYQNQPISSAVLSALLWHSMRIKEEIICDPGLPRSYEGLLRPVASAGALHSIELYLCVHRCHGLQPGFYHYDSGRHCLGKLSDLSEPCLRMLELAAASTCRAPQAASVSPGQAQQPDVLIVMASRYARQAGLHRQTGLSYALILKDVGSIYQQLYLVATALGLAPCGLSFGSSELFEQASGLPTHLECSVGEFMIGNPG